MNDAARIEEIAATWHVRRESPQWSARDQAELDAWLAESTLHEVAYLRLEYGWRKVDRLAALRSAAAASPEQPAAIKQTLYRRRPMLLAASVLLVCSIVAAGFWMQIPETSQKSYTTEVGEHSTVSLPDGSRMELNTRTRVHATVNRERRLVWLESGEAYFEVVHDVSRPFIVQAGQRRITVLGTKFSVRREGEDVRVAVFEGRVQVDALEHAQAVKRALAVRGDTVVVAGEVGLLVTPHPVAKVEDALSWRQGLLVFDQVTLAQAAAEFNRYNRKQLVIDDPAAADIPIGGRFEAANVDAFVRLIRQGLKLKVEEQGDVIRIST